MNKNTPLGVVIYFGGFGSAFADSALSGASLVPNVDNPSNICDTGPEKMGGFEISGETQQLIEDTQFQPEYKVRIVGQILILLAALPLNAFVIYKFVGGRGAGEERARVNILAGHLCCINLAYTLFSIPLDIIWHLTGQLNQQLLFLKIFRIYVVLESVFTCVLI